MVNKELITRLIGFKFPLLDAYRWTIILNAFPLSNGKQKAFNKALASSSASALMGILTDHLMKVAKIVGIPSVYLRDVAKSRMFKIYGIYNNRLKKETNNILSAVCESLEGIVQKSIE